MLQFPQSVVIRRHRLPPLYRVGLTVMWIVPLLLFIGAILIKRGVDAGLFDPRFVVPSLLMIAPALYFWREGVDVLRDGITRRIHLPHQYVGYESMKRWSYDQRSDRHVLTIWDERDEKILECRAGHLTDFPALLDVLREHVERDSIAAAATDSAAARSNAE